MTMRGLRALGVLAGLLVLASPGAAAPDTSELDHATVIFQRGAALVRSDTRGKAELELATLPAGTHVRALYSDARGTALLVDLGGTWAWMPLDGKAQTLAPLPCADAPAQLEEAGTCVLCRAKAATGSILVNLATGKSLAVDVTGGRIAGSGAQRKLIWSDASGIWSAPPAELKRKTQLAPQPPLRAFLPSFDGTRAFGVYSDFVYEGKKKQPSEMLMGFALDGQAARRKGLPTALPLQWSHDNQYVLMQDGNAACLVRAMGGQYKCWKGYIAVSVAPDGSYALVLGQREGKPATGALPSGPLALYRAKLAGPYDETPALVTKLVDGAAVWIPARP